MVGWSKAETEVVVSLSGVDRLLLKRVADALDPVTVQPTAEKPRRLREPAYENPEWVVPKETVDRIGLAGLKKLASANEAQPEVEVALTADELAVLDDVDGGWVSSEVGAVALSGDDYTAFGGDVV